jgi:5-methylcytosine-specific restriction endonuclease McrA
VEIASAGILEWQKLRCYNGIMNKNSRSLSHLTNEQLLEEVKLLAGREREATARLIASLAELDARRLYLGAGFSSLFTYCTQCLHLSEHAAYGRIEAARAARKCPVVLDMLVDGSLTLTTLCLLAGHLTPDNHGQLLEAAKGKSKREVELQVAALRPSPAVPAFVRKLPSLQPNAAQPHSVPRAASQRVPSPTAVAASESASTHLVVRPTPLSSRPAVVAPLSPERYKVQLTISRETHDKLRRVQDLLRHSIPDGDPAVVFDHALTLLLADLERRKLAQTSRPRSAAASASTTHGSRHVPSAVKREVWKRDGGQCAFAGASGRCTERGFLEYHHVVPFADGGATTSANLQLRCRAHNVYEAELHFGTLMLREDPEFYELGPDRATWQTEMSRRSLDE